MTHPAPIPETPTAASAAEALAGDMEALTELRMLGLELARAIQAEGVTAAKTRYLAKAGVAATHFDRLALGVRRLIALRARLLERQQQDQDQAEDRRTNDRPRSTIAAAVSPRASAVPSPR